MMISITIPKDNVLCDFNETLHSCFETMTTNTAENFKLIALRDALLPRLMSGELQISMI